jgi:hypothetical protein
MRIFDFQSYAYDNGIDLATEGSKHTRPGWVQMACPFCTGNPGYHLGFNLDRGYFNCYRCGWHSVFEVVQRLAGASIYEVERIVKEYSAGGKVLTSPNKKKKTGSVECRLPTGTGEMNKRHIRYLLGRGFRAAELVDTWGLLGTGPVGPYCHRIVAPIVLDGKLVSYQCRDITGKSNLPYKACSLEQEVIHHKELLYGENLVGGNSIVIVEGVADAWKLGPGAVATFGIGFTTSQVLRMKKYQRRFILYDNDVKREGQVAAKKLASILMGFDGETEIVTLKGVKDPGELPERDAKQLMEDFLP